MKVTHVALVCSSEENADGFYMNVLGLTKEDPKLVSSSLSLSIFNIEAEIRVINYTGVDIRFEVFIYTRPGSRTIQIEHVCIEVDHLDDFLSKCRNSNVKVIQEPKGEKMVTFIRDFDDNLFEVIDK